MSKRLSKEELESDPLIENYNRAANYYDQNKTTINVTLIALLLLVGGFFGYQYYAGEQENQAQQLLSIAENYYLQGQYENALYGDDFELTYGFEQIADEFPRTKAGNIALYYAAVSSFELGDMENALNYIEKFDVPEGILGVGPLVLHAKIHMDNENYEAAAQKFLEAAEWNDNNSTTPSNLYEAANAYYQAGNYDRANELVNRVIEDYPQSNMVTESQRLKGMLATK